MNHRPDEGAENDRGRVDGTKLALVVEKALYVFFVLLGIGVLIKVGEFPYPLFKNIGMSPGIFPWLLGVLLISLSALELALSLVRRARGIQKRRDVTEFRNIRPLWIILASVAYTALLPCAGYLIGTALWVFLLFLIFKPQSRILVPLIFVLLIVVTYLIFQLYLPVRLPSGVF